MIEPTDSRMQLPAFRSLSGMSKARLLGYAWDRHQELEAARARIRLLEQQRDDAIAAIVDEDDPDAPGKPWLVEHVLDILRANSAPAPKEE